MIQANEQYAYFSVVTDGDPADITARVGVTPTESWRRGDLCPRTRRERKFGRWSLFSRLERDAELEAHVRDVLEQLSVDPDAFAAMSRELGGTMQLVAYFYGDYPGLHFTRDVAESIGRYGLAVDFDFYGLYSHRREDT